MFQSAQKSDSKQKKDNSSGKENGSRLDPSVYFHVPDLTYGAAEVAQLKEEEELQRKEATSPVAQRMVEEEEEKAVQGKSVQGQEEEELQMKASSNSSKEGTNSSGTTVRIPEEVQAKMEGSFGTSFSDVNIHSNDNSATHMGALAYTQGNNVHFAPGQYNPGTSKGQELLGHELTHVVQQRHGRVQPVKQGKGMPVNDSPSLEDEADVMGKKAADGERVDSISSVSNINTGQVQFKEKEDVKGEIGLKNGSVERERGEVTVGGENAEGEGMRPVTYENEEEYQQSEDRIAELKNSKKAATHAFFEFVAHFLAYQPEGYEVDRNKNILNIIEQNGYMFDAIEEGRLGFQYVKLISKRSDQNDIVAFRGTKPGIKPSELGTIYADTDPTAVGYQQFLMNKGKIQGALRGKGKVDIAGHSLGGGLAQIVASYYTSQIGNVYTFQAPGIDDKMIARFNQSEEKPNVHHHIAIGDMVDKAGEQNLPGNVYAHDFGTFWIHSKDLLQQCGANIMGVAKGVFGTMKESGSITDNVVKGVLESGIPLVGDHLLQKRIEKICTDIQDMNNQIDSVKAEASALKELLGNVVTAIGEAHLGFMFSSDNFKEARTEAHIDDSFYTSKNKEQGAGKDKMNEASVVTAHESYPFQDERGIAEPIRDAVGSFIYTMLLSPAQIFLAYETVDFIIAAIEAVKNAMIALWELLVQLASSAWDAIKSIPDKLRATVDEIGYWINYMNTIDFWMDLYRM